MTIHHEPIEATPLDALGLPGLPWSQFRELLESGMPSADSAFFLGTAGPDGRPHAAGIGPLWMDGDIYFKSGPGTRKSRHLAANPACTLSVRLAGADLVLEGEATRVTDPATVARAAARYRDVGWPAEAVGDTLTAPYSAPTAGPPPWYLYRLQVLTAYALATEEPGRAMRWRFAR